MNSVVQHFLRPGKSLTDLATMLQQTGVNCVVTSAPRVLHVTRMLRVST